MNIRLTKETTTVSINVDGFSFTADDILEKLVKPAILAFGYLPEMVHRISILTPEEYAARVTAFTEQCNEEMKGENNGIH